MARNEVIGTMPSDSCRCGCHDGRPARFLVHDAGYANEHQVSGNGREWHRFYSISQSTAETVSGTSSSLSCNCPAWINNVTRPCKHIRRWTAEERERVIQFAEALPRQRTRGRVANAADLERLERQLEEERSARIREGQERGSRDLQVAARRSQAATLAAETRRRNKRRAIELTPIEREAEGRTTEIHDGQVRRRIVLDE